MSSQVDEKATQRWKDLSELVLRARVESRATSANPALDHFIKEDPDGPAAPAMAIWRADNFVFDRYFDDAARAHEETAQRHGQELFNGVSWATYALDQAAYCHEQRGRVDQAMKVLEKLLTFKEHGSEAWIHYRRGQILEGASRDKEAIEAYRKAESSSDEPSTSSESIPDLSRRAADRIEKPERLEPFPDRLATQITRALDQRDTALLESLASKTHFCIGVAGSELKFIEYGKIASYLNNDVATAEIRVDPASLQGKGNKLYLYTDDWKGELLHGRVYFLLTRARDGWEWSGLVLTQVEKAYFELFPPAPEAKNQLPQIAIKAPYPAGVCFRAGGLRRFGESFLPFFGAGIFLADNFSGCGYGPGGFYYNEGSTHQGQEAFAIDFTRYLTFLPFIMAAGGIQTLAVQAGIVTMVRSNIASGNSSVENRVQIDHPSLGELTRLAFRGDFTVAS